MASDSRRSFICFLAMVMGVLAEVASSTLDAAEITTSTTPSCNLRLFGPIVRGDADKLEALLSKTERRARVSFPGQSNPIERHDLCLNSPGGDLSEALRLIRVLARDNDTEKIGTIVESGAVCRGPCAFLFMAGRYHAFHGVTFPLRQLHPGGRVEFTTLSSDPAAGGGDAALSMAFTAAIRDVAQIFKVNVGAELLDGSVIERNKIFPRSLIARILQLAPGQSLTIETVEQANLWQIAVTGLAAPKMLTRGMLAQACSNVANENGAGNSKQFVAESPQATIDLVVPVSRTTFTLNAGKRRHVCHADVVSVKGFGPALNIQIIPNATTDEVRSATTDLETNRKFLQDELGGDGGPYGLIGNDRWLIWPPATRLTELPRLTGGR